MPGLADVPGITAGDLGRFRRAGVRDLAGARRAILAGRVSGVSSMAAAFIRWRPARSLPAARARHVAHGVARVVRVVQRDGRVAQPHRVDVVGSVRRLPRNVPDARGPIKDIDILVTLRRGAGKQTPALRLAGRRYRIVAVYAAGSRRVSAIVEDRRGTHARCHVDFFFAAPAERPFALLHHTGPWKYNVRLRTHAKTRGWKLNQYGLWDKRGRRVRGSVGLRSEKSVVRLLGATYYPPSRRA